MSRARTGLGGMSPAQWARLWWSARWSEATSTKARAALLARYCTPGAAARLLAEVSAHRREYHALREQPGCFQVGSAAWRAGARHGARARARDGLWALRQAREAGRLHQPFKRSGGEAWLEVYEAIKAHGKAAKA